MSNYIKEYCWHMYTRMQLRKLWLTLAVLVQSIYMHAMCLTGCKYKLDWIALYKKQLQMTQVVTKAKCMCCTQRVAARPALQSRR